MHSRLGSRSTPLVWDRCSTPSRRRGELASESVLSSIRPVRGLGMYLWLLGWWEQSTWSGAVCGTRDHSLFGKASDLGPTGNNMGPTKQESAVLVTLPNTGEHHGLNTHKGAS